MAKDKSGNKRKCQTCYHAKVTAGENVLCFMGFPLGHYGRSLDLPLKRIGYKKVMPCMGRAWEDADA